jgi:hypothetical protein
MLDFIEVASRDLPIKFGFRNGAQCNDHILTFDTIIEKYVKKVK